MKKTLKKILSITFVAFIVFSFSVSPYAAPADTQTKWTSEFGTMTGYIEYIGKYIGLWKNINFETDISHLSNKGVDTIVYAGLDVCDYLTGDWTGSDAWTETNKLRSLYTMEAESDAINNRRSSAFGTHEARGLGSETIYTDIHDF